MLSVSPDDEGAREALSKHLSDLRESARDLGLVHLEAAVAEAMSRLEQDAFGPGSLVVVRVLAWRYETLAAMPSQSGTHRMVSERTPRAAKVSLRGRRVLVAEAVAELRWFYVGVLREAGARVVEARDGVHALELTRANVPDLVLGAVEMPRLDGLGLCAALRREPAFDGVPVVLLSKRGSAEEILNRVSRALEPLDRLEQWLESDLEASGDLEELGVSGLLRAARRLRPNATMVLQDPWSLFDLELSEGHVVAVTRTAIDGIVTEGVAAFPPLVGMSSGRFVVAENSPSDRGEERESLDAAFAEATDRLGALLSTMATHVDCRVELDQAALATYVRHSPIAVQRLITRLVAGEPPNALWESGAGSRGLVDAVLVTLARQGAIRDVRVPAREDARGPVEPTHRARRELLVSDIEQDSGPVGDPVERENIRAQLAIAMHREPANLAPGASHRVWRLNPNARTAGGERGSGFGMEMQTTPRLLGFAFLVMLSATVALLLWRQATPGPAPASSSPVATVAGPADGDAAGEPHAEVPVAALPADVPAFSGRLREEVDPTLGVTEGQGVLELRGPGDVSVEVDGVDRGALPVTLVLDAGRHAVRYRSALRSTDRFYYVRSGATRDVNVLTQAGGLVDPR